MAADHGAFIWYELMTTDPEGAKSFYDAVVGWSLSTGHGDDDSYGFITRSDGGMNGGVLRLSPEMLEHGARPCWVGYLHVPDVDSAVSMIEAAGGHTLMPATDNEIAGRFAMVADPQGAVFYVMTPKPPPGASDAKSTVFSPDKAQHIRWNELWASDPEAAVVFYKDLCCWTQEGAMPMGELGDYRFIQHEGIGIGAICPVMPGGSGPRWNIYIGVDDIDRAMAAIAAGGGTLLGDAQEIPGGEFSAHARDPQGADFGIVGPRH
ncbi:MAG: VOC family protein [Erythrobacter sp.]